MRAAVIHGKHDVRLENVPDPVLHFPTDAVVRVVASSVCGSDLWRYRGAVDVSSPARIGHEFVGVIESVGNAVSIVKVGDFVIAPFYHCDMTCTNCLNGVSSSCTGIGWWGVDDASGVLADGGQSEHVRVPRADGTLVVLPDAPDPKLIPALLTLCDVMGTGHHAAFSAGVREGSTVAVIGDGAVGLCAIIAAKRLGASRIIAMSRNPQREALARRFGASEVVSERGPLGAARVIELLDGVGADAALECVGTAESMDQALRSTRPGGMVGYVGAPHGGAELPIKAMFNQNVGVNGGVAPVRNYIEQLLPDVLSGAIEPGLVFDLELPLHDVADAYAAMSDRAAIKVMLRP